MRDIYTDFQSLALVTPWVIKEVESKWHYINIGWQYTAGMSPSMSVRS